MLIVSEEDGFQMREDFEVFDDMVERVGREFEMLGIPLNGQYSEELVLSEKIEAVFFLWEFHSLYFVSVFVIFVFLLIEFLIEEEELISCDNTNGWEGYDFENVSNLKFLLRIIPQIYLTDKLLSGILRLLQMVQQQLILLCQGKPLIGHLDEL